MTYEPMTQRATEERNWAIAAHLSALVGAMGLPFGHLIGPLAVYLVQRGQSPFVASHARASLNFQITVSIAAVLFLLAAFAGWITLISALSSAANVSPLWTIGGGITILCVLLLGAVGSIILIVMGAIAAGDGRPYRYPLAIPFVR